jgi:hypothetical protein
VIAFVVTTNSFPRRTTCSERGALTRDEQDDGNKSYAANANSVSEVAIQNGKRFEASWANLSTKFTKNQVGLANPLRLSEEN